MIEVLVVAVQSVGLPPITESDSLDPRMMFFCQSPRLTLTVGG